MPNAEEGDHQPLIPYAFAGLLPVAVGGALVAVRGEVVTANLGLVMVLTVVLAAAVGGRGPGVLSAVIAAMSFDFFLTRPYLSLKIERTDDLETTLVLLVIGLAVGQIAVRARRARRAARQGSDQIGRLHRIAELVASGSPVDQVIASVEHELTDLLQLRSCRFDRAPSNGWLPVMERSGVVSGVHIRYFAGREFMLPEQGVELPVLARGREVGRLVLEPEPGFGISLEERTVAVALSDQLGAVIAADGAPAA